MYTEKQLIRIEKTIADLWDRGDIHYPVHLSGGNEKQLIDIFKRCKISNRDFIVSTHRSHYHYLLKGATKKMLLEKVMHGDSMHIIDRKLNFFSTAIVSGGCAIACGLAYTLTFKSKLPNHPHRPHVYCFIGDGATDEGHFYESVKFATCHDLPIYFIVEDNNRSVCSTKNHRFTRTITETCKELLLGRLLFDEFKSSKIIRYTYTPTYPHVGTGKHITIKGAKSYGEVGSTL